MPARRGVAAFVGVAGAKAGVVRPGPGHAVAAEPGGDEIMKRSLNIDRTVPIAHAHKVA
jgi:hypothetical protein